MAQQPRSTDLDEGSAKAREMIADPNRDTYKGGRRECAEMMDGMLIEAGMIVCIIRSFSHHYFKEGEGAPFGIALAMRLLAKNSVKEEGRAKLVEFGQKERGFAYVHTAVYVGKSGGKHWVVENAGGGRGSLAKLCLHDVDRAFNDLVEEKSEFFLFKPKSPEQTAQRAMAAYAHGFEFQYDGIGFNCESFTSCCAGLFTSEDHAVRDAGLHGGPNPIFRALRDSDGSLAPERIAVANDNLRRHVGELLGLFEEETTRKAIVGSKYRLDCGGGDSPVGIFVGV